MATPKIALIGDYNQAVTAHRAIPRALELASRAVERQIDWAWIGTDTIQKENRDG